jgi:hypothetical protein
MRLQELFEAKVNKTKASAAFCFGRFNPAHQGHVEVWKTVESVGLQWFVGTNPNTQGPNDPLSFEQKSLWMQRIWQPISGHILPETTVLTTAASIYKKLGKGEHTIAYITDESDWRWSGKLLSDYNGKETAHGFYQFASIIHVPSPRVSSATELRNAARAGDEAAFYRAAGTDPSLKVKGKTYFETVHEACAKFPEKKKKVKEGLLDDPQLLAAAGATMMAGTALGANYIIDKIHGKAEDLILDHLNKKYPATEGEGRWRSEADQVKYREAREDLWNTYHNGGLLGLFRRIRAEKKELNL